VLTLEFSNRQNVMTVDVAAWERLLRLLFRDEGVARGEVSVSVVHADEIQRLNRQYLAHDYPTDVLSFVLERRYDALCGEIVVSADMALARCGEFDLSAHDELTLYLIHGALHLVGYDDKDPDDCLRMREREQHYLQQVAASVRAGDEGDSDSAPANERAAHEAAPRAPGV
jgi:probable rRNA maturation factor